MEPILDVVDADVLVSDDADAFKKVSDETGRAHQVCKSHVGRNSDALGAELSALIQAGQDKSLETIGVTTEQAVADLAQLKILIHSRQPEEQTQLEQMYQRYANARKLAKGKRFDVAYWMRNLCLDRWNLRPRLTFYRTWRDEYGHPKLDGTNNGCDTQHWLVGQRALSLYERLQTRAIRSQCQPSDCFRWQSLIARIGFAQSDCLIGNQTARWCGLFPFT